MKTAAEIVVVFKKFLENRHSQADLDALIAYFDQAVDYTTLRDLVYEELKRLDSEGVDQQEIKELLQDVDHKLANRMRRHRITRLYIRSAGVAAILIATLTTGYYFYQHQSPVQDNVPIVNEIKPGYNQATLTLADGRKVALDSAQSGIIVQGEDIKYQNGESVSGRHPSLSRQVGRLDPGSLSAKTSPKSSEMLNQVQHDELLQLSTPKGGQYQIILSDGTKVWLNAASTLKYPSRFSGDKREVFLQGEAFFEVNNKSVAGSRMPRGPSVGSSTFGAPKPFIVRSRDQETIVLGTEFNLNSYDPIIKTTLVTGAVQVVNYTGSDEKGRTAITLSPGEQSIIKGDELTKSKVDINSELAWRQNKFSFDGKTFRQIMHEVARWYDLEVVYDGPVPEATFFGDAYRNKNLSIVLGLLESAHIHYQVAPGHRLVIHNQNGKDKPKPKK